MLRLQISLDARRLSQAGIDALPASPAALPVLHDESAAREDCEGIVKTIAQRTVENFIPVVLRKGELVARMNEGTFAYLAGPHRDVIVGPTCSCRSFRLPHSPEQHSKLRGDWDWRTWQERKDFGGEVYAPRSSRKKSDVPEDVREEWYA